MSEDGRVLSAVYRAVDEVNVMLPPDSRIEKLADTPLLDAASGVDSLTLVNLVVETETVIEEEFGLHVVLADEKAMTIEPSPFATIGSFARYVESLLKESVND
ncbi:MAG: hypothetical protein ACYTDY_03560 [Planctomycetota bacterium]